ncbi:MAG: histidine phosphatase family protein [Candidatus Binatia bacterium]
MDLILWRHAEAEEGAPDAARRLTKKGERQAEKMAEWLRSRIPKSTRVLVSPAARTRQTAAALSSEFETVEEIGVGSSAQRILRATGWPKAEGTVIVVGHQPTLGQLAALLLSGMELDWNIKKGAVWWFQTQGHETEPLLHAVVAPRHV